MMKINSHISTYLLILIFQLVAFGLLTSAKTNDTSNGAKISPTQNQQVPASSIQNSAQQCNIKLNKIYGNIYSLQHDDEASLRMSLMNSKILVNYGQYIAYPREDGSFEIDNLPSDSYVVEVTHPKYVYEPYRVDITSKGKIRARRVNYVQPSLVQTVDYPLIFKPKSLHNYFYARETWRITDVLLNPMVIMMVIPVFIIWLLPKMVNPQEMQSQRESTQLPEYNVPELSEMMANMFSGQGQNRGGAQSGGSAGGDRQAIAAGGGSSARHTKSKRR